MNKKVIAIGNRLMSDDAIGIVVTERIKDWLISKNYDVIIGETDIDYYMNFVNKRDLIIFIDAKYEGVNPGEITIKHLYLGNNLNLTSQHERLSIFDSNNERLSGYLIGIEIATIEIGIGISELLEERLYTICEQVKQYIKTVENNFALEEFNERKNFI